MSFIWPWVLVSLLALPVCVYVYVRLQRRRREDAASLGALGSVREGVSTLAGRRRHVPPIIFLNRRCTAGSGFGPSAANSAGAPDGGYRRADVRRVVQHGCR